jgi:hypothetical protein
MLADRSFRAYTILCCSILLLFPVSSTGATRKPVSRVANRSELQQAIADARPGTIIRIAPGTYDGGLSFENLHGQKDRPIVLEALDAKHPPRIEGGTTGLHLIDPRFVVLRHLSITGASGNGLNIDDGGTYATPAEHIRLENIHIFDIGPDGNRDGIKLSGVDHFVIQDCRLERWGDGGSGIDMVGCHDGEITGCHFRYREQLPANAVQTKGGTARIKVHHCRFENAGSRAVNIGGSTGRPYFRPPNPGYEAKDILVEDCTFIGSDAPIAFVGVDGAIVRYNTIYQPSRWVMRILQESRGPDFVPCRDGQFTNNVIVFRTDELRTTVNIGSGTAPESFSLADNFWYCQDRPERSSRLTLPVSEKNGHYGIAPRFVDEQQLDLRLTRPSPIKNAGARP